MTVSNLGPWNKVVKMIMNIYMYTLFYYFVSVFPDEKSVTSGSKALAHAVRGQGCVRLWASRKKERKDLDIV